MELIHLSEPSLVFADGQRLEDPRDGLTLFGPLDEGRPFGIRAGVVGTETGIRLYKEWVTRVQSVIEHTSASVVHPSFPGFEAVFGIPWPSTPRREIVIDEKVLSNAAHFDDPYQRVFRTVELYSRPILEAIRGDDEIVDLWFAVIPDYVYKYCRPKSPVEVEVRTIAPSKWDRRPARVMRYQVPLFAADEVRAQPYLHELNFHNQLKGKLLHDNALTQVIRESTLLSGGLTTNGDPAPRDLEPASAVAWNLSCATFYKSGGRPWKIGDIREGVCYIGIVFKRDESSVDSRSACCAAQMFLDSGDGIVFKGAVGPWYSPKYGSYHLSREKARSLVSLALHAYEDRKGALPNELFLHGKVRFDDNEWSGFTDAVRPDTNLVGIRIQKTNEFKLFRRGKHPILRGTALVRDEHTAFLWTKGFIPRLQTYAGWEVPNPLLVDVCRGNAVISTVLSDILALTKLNYNSCKFSDGVPVTLRFADAVGEILTSGPIEAVPPLPFRHYI